MSAKFRVGDTIVCRSTNLFGEPRERFAIYLKEIWLGLPHDSISRGVIWATWLHHRDNHSPFVVDLEGEGWEKCTREEFDSGIPEKIYGRHT